MPITTGKATDFITFSRASNTTVMDADGKIKWAAHNLLLASEQFDASNWTKTSATVTANSIAAPNSTTTADTVTASGANGTALQTWTAEAVSYTFGVWLKRKTGTGNIQIAADNGTYTTVTITSDWALYTVTQTPAAGSKSAGIRIVTSGDEVYVWGAHLYRSDLGGMVANTSAYPYYNPTTPKNLLGYTEDFSNAAWTKTAATISANVVIAPNGLQTADKIVETTANTTHLFGNSSAVTVASGGLITMSVYAKAAERSWIALYDVITSKGKFFNISTGTVGGNLVGAPVSAAITPVGDGWYRCSIVLTAGASAALAVYLSTDGTAFIYTGDGVSGAYLWGAQLSDSASLDTYVANNFAAPTASAYYGPRLDYDPSTLAAKGLLVEEQRTNALTYSADYSNAIWAKTFCSVTANAAIGPDGTNTAFKLASDTSTNQHQLTQNATFASNTTYAYSVIVKAAERTNFGFGVGGNSKPIVTTFNFSTLTFSGDNTTGGPIVSKSYQALANGFYRVTLVFTTDSSGTVPNTVRISDTNFAGSAGDGTSGIFVAGQQLETGSFATSYIPTTSATVTRSADVAQVSTQAFPYSASEGTLVVAADFIGQSSGVTHIAALSDGLPTNFMTIRRPSTGEANLIVNDGGSNQVNITGQAIVNNVVFKNSAAYKLNDYAFAGNGLLLGTDTSATVPISSVLSLGNIANVLTVSGHIRQITYIPRRLTNAELQQRTA